MKILIHLKKILAYEKNLIRIKIKELLDFKKRNFSAKKDTV